jgi:hypothetical protein
MRNDEAGSNMWDTEETGGGSNVKGDGVWSAGRLGISDSGCIRSAILDGGDVDEGV